MSGQAKCGRCMQCNIIQFLSVSEGVDVLTRRIKLPLPIRVLIGISDTLFLIQPFSIHPEKQQMMVQVTVSFPVTEGGRRR